MHLKCTSTFMNVDDNIRNSHIFSHWYDRSTHELSMLNLIIYVYPTNCTWLVCTTMGGYKNNHQHDTCLNDIALFDLMSPFHFKIRCICHYHSFSCWNYGVRHLQGIVHEPHLTYFGPYPTSLFNCILLWNWITC